MRAGVPEELVRRRSGYEVADAEFERNSIPGLANVWSNALAAEGAPLPTRISGRRATSRVADVNRVARVPRRRELDHGRLEAGAHRPARRRPRALAARNR